MFWSHCHSVEERTNLRFLDLEAARGTPGLGWATRYRSGRLTVGPIFMVHDRAFGCHPCFTLVDLHHASTSDPIATTSSGGLVFKAMLHFAREVAGPPLRTMG